MKRGIIIVAGAQGSGKTHFTNTITVDETKTYIGISNELDLNNTFNLINNIQTSQLTNNLIVECSLEILKPCVDTLSRLYFKRVIIEVNCVEVIEPIKVENNNVGVSIVYTK